MANIIDALFITLGLDTREYEKKQKEVGTSLKKLGDASDKQTKLIAESGKRAAGAFSALKIEILGALAAFGMGAGFKAFIESSINGQAQLGRLSTALGMSTHSLQAWKLMAQEMGGSGDEAIATMQKVASGMAAARRGDISFLATANKYGAADQNGHILTMDDNVETAMSKIGRMAYLIRQKYGAQQAMGVLNELGISDFNQQQLLMEDPAKRAADFAHAMSLTGAATKTSTEQAARLQKQVADLHERFRQVGERAFVKLEPILEKLATQLADWLDSVDWDKVIKKAGEFFDKLGQIVDALGGVKGILIEIAAIKVFGWVANIGMWVIKLRSLTTALTAARAAAAAGAIPTPAPVVPPAAKAIPIATRLAMWAFPIWALFHSESTGGKRRADGTYEDEFDWNSPEGQAAIAKQKAAQKTAATRGMRNNNPGNIKYGDFARSMGATGQDLGGFAIFPTPQQGIAAIAANLRSYGRKGFDTPSEIAHRWSTTDQAAYTKTLAALFGGNANKQLDMTSNAVIAALTNGIISQENGSNPYAQMVAGSSNMAYVGAPRSPQASTAKPSTTTNTVTINGPINVNAPKATDANGVAMGMKKALNDNPLISGSVTALA